MHKKTSVPDAWDDDWEAQADGSGRQEHDNEDSGGASLQPAAVPALTKAERITKHEEANRKIWESADSTPQTFHYLEASSTVPLTSSFKPQVMVLSRKPVVAKRDPATSGVAQLSIDDVDDDDADKDKKERPLTVDEIRAKQKRDLEERQRRYDEARAKIFGESNPSSRGSSPGTVTPPPRSDSRHSARSRGRVGTHQRNANSHTASSNNSPGSSNDARGQHDARKPSHQASVGRELYDPNFSIKPDWLAQRRLQSLDGEAAGRGAARKDDHLRQQSPIRSPRGPDGSGRGGFGFARRGNKES